ncbi:MAG TPA: M20/M25/M40 family metallo-hydrolase [Novosphingobium sp.]|nr:M20/M25/M40 family metallo-hydrolase [Novosphingobium sp.]
MRTFVLALMGAVVLAILATTPPGPRGSAAPADAFSASRAMEHVRRIADRPHVTGSAENAAVRGYIAERMQALGMEVTTRDAPLSDRGRERLIRWSGMPPEAAPRTLTNVIGILPGRDRSLPAVMLMAHHDTVWGSPGASDDTAGVAASLEVVRAIAAKGPPPRDLIVLVTDAEELGLEGAEHFFAADPLRSRVGAIINMEARGGGGRTSLFQTSRGNGAAVQLYAGAVSRPAASSLAAYVYSVLPNDTDLTPAIAGPYTAYNFAFIGRPGLYHSPLATPDRLDQGSLQDMGGQVLDLTGALLSVPILPDKAPDAVFFDLFGLTTVIFPVWLGWLMLVQAGLLLAMVIRRDGRGGLVEGAARMLGLLLIGGGLLYLFNQLSLGFARGEYYDRLAAIPRLEGMALLIGGAVFLAMFGARKGTPVLTAGAALPLWLLALVAQVLAPTAAYVLTLPLLLVGAVLWRPGAVQAGATAAVVTGYMLALGHQLMQGVGPTLPMAAALPLALGVLALLPVWPGIEKRRAGILAALLLTSAAAVALWVQLDAPAETRAVYADSKR